jgi:hypothetical protein
MRYAMPSICNVSMPSETMVCPGCGTDLTVLFTVQTLQLDLQRARNQSASVAMQLDQLQSKMGVSVSAGALAPGLPGAVWGDNPQSVSG